MEKVSSEVMLEDFELDEAELSEEIRWSDSDLQAGTELLQLPEGIRLDVGVTERLGKSRSFVQGIIAQDLIKVNGLPKKANYKVRRGDRVEVTIPPPRDSTTLPENIPLEILYEDEDVLIVNKPQGMVVHPAPGAWTGTMVNALLFHCRNLSGINGVLRPGIVHRIDKDTSGILVVAKNDMAHLELAAQLKAHSMERIYLTLVHGTVPEPSGTVDAPIGRDPGDRKRMAVVLNHSKAAVTHYRVLERFQEMTFLEVRLETGRTHQIRVHMAYLKHPVLGDPVYGPQTNKYAIHGQMLHAAHLGFKHPRTGIWMKFDVPLPDMFATIIQKLRLKPLA